MKLLITLNCLHKNGLIHLDIKPENIMMRELTDELTIEKLTNIRLIDFGLSCMKNEIEIQKLKATLKDDLESAPKRRMIDGLIARMGSRFRNNPLLDEAPELTALNKIIESETGEAKKIKAQRLLSLILEQVKSLTESDRIDGVCKPGRNAGTLCYAPPKILSKSINDESCDIWSATVVFYMLLTALILLKEIG